VRTPLRQQLTNRRRRHLYERADKLLSPAKDANPPGHHESTAPTRGSNHERRQSYVVDAPLEEMLDLGRAVKLLDSASIGA
jgi:hypothetical protein